MMASAKIVKKYPIFIAVDMPSMSYRKPCHASTICTVRFNTVSPAQSHGNHSNAIRRQRFQISILFNVPSIRFNFICLHLLQDIVSATHACWSLLTLHRPSHDEKKKKIRESPLKHPHQISKSDLHTNTAQTHKHKDREILTKFVSEKR